MELVVVDREQAGMRLDLFLSRRKWDAFIAEDWSRSGIQKLISGGQITLNARKTKPSTRLKAGDLIEIEALPAKEIGLAPEAVALQILYEDEDCIAVNKAPGMVVHPAAGKRTGTLVNALLHHCPDLQGIGGEQRPGIVHRLDKDTSGVIIVAKHEQAFHGLALQFEERKVVKEYLALVWGKMKQERGAIERPIGRHRSDRKRMSSLYSLSRKREAATEWQLEQFFRVGTSESRFSWVSWLRVKPRTGRTHQIRVHLADQGYPIVGDRVYGSRRQSVSDPLAPRELLEFPRQALHAERMQLKHPRTGAPLDLRAPLFSDMEGLLDRLGRCRAELQEKSALGG